MCSTAVSLRTTTSSGGPVCSPATVAGAAATATEVAINACEGLSSFSCHSCRRSAFLNTPNTNSSSALCNSNYENGKCSFSGRNGVLPDSSGCCCDGRGNEGVCCIDSPGPQHTGRSPSDTLNTDTTGNSPRRNSGSGDQRLRRSTGSSNSKSNSSKCTTNASCTSNADEKQACYSSEPRFICCELSPLRPGLTVALAFCEDVRNMPMLCSCSQLQKRPSMVQQDSTPAVASAGTVTPTRLAASATAESSARDPSGHGIGGGVAAGGGGDGAADAPAFARHERRTAEPQGEVETTELHREDQPAELQREVASKELQRDVCVVGMNPSLIASIDQIMLGVLTAVQQWEKNCMHAADLKKEILYCCSPGGRSISRSLQQLGMQPQQHHLLLVAVKLPYPALTYRNNPSERGEAASCAIDGATHQQQQIHRQHEEREAHWEVTQQDRFLLLQHKQDTEDPEGWWKKTEGRWRVDIEQALRDNRDETLLRAVAQISDVEEALPGHLEAAVLARVAAKFI